MFPSLLTLALTLSGPAAAGEPLVVVGHPNAPALSREDIAGIYLGRRSSLRPMDQPVASEEYSAFYRQLTGRTPAEVRSAWAAIVFTGRGRAPPVMDNADMLKRTIAADPQAIGYLKQSAVDNRVRVLLVLPTDTP